MKIENITSQQWHLYDYLKEHCVGRTNAQSMKQIGLALGYQNTRDLRADIAALRQAPLRKISSGVAGYYLPISADDEDHSLKARLYGAMVTALSNGDISKNEIYAFLNEFDIDHPQDWQMKLQLGPNEEDVKHIYSGDLWVELTIDQKPQNVQYEYYRKKYLDMGGYPIKLTISQYKEEIKKMEEENEKQKSNV